MAMEWKMFFRLQNSHFSAKFQNLCTVSCWSFVCAELCPFCNNLVSLRSVRFALARCCAKELINPKLRRSVVCAAMNIAKWLPKQNNDMNKIFTETRNIERELRIMGKQFATNINYKNPDYYVSRALVIFSLRAWIKTNIPYQSRRLGLPGPPWSRQSSARGELAHAVQGCARI